MDFHKGETFFLPYSCIPTAMDYVHKRPEDQSYLRGQKQHEFVREAGSVIGEINYIHPFREGNGRTQALYLRQLGAQAGHQIDLCRLNKRAWMEASIDAAKGSPNYDKLRWCIDRAIEPVRDRTRDRGR
ncbi:MAG: Fic family protein [Erythrobacter sp.]|uniref:Fic family protein n=1 Tax=Erythrobacter sp. TaxID=1042 RepID=UPI00326666DF